MCSSQLVLGYKADRMMRCCFARRGVGDVKASKWGEMGEWCCCCFSSSRKGHWYAAHSLSLMPDPSVFVPLTACTAMCDPGVVLVRCLS